MPSPNTHKRIPKVHRQTLTAGSRSVKVVVPIFVDLFLVDGKWEETVSASEWRKVELAIERAWPGWFHRFKDGQHSKDCPACKRKKVA